MLFVGVRCPVDVIMRRRAAGQPGREGDYVTGEAGREPPEPVLAWQRAVHDPGLHDLDVDTALLSPGECPAVIADRLAAGASGPTAFEQLAPRDTA